MSSESRYANFSEDNLLQITNMQMSLLSEEPGLIPVLRGVHVLNFVFFALCVWLICVLSTVLFSLGIVCPRLVVL